MAHDVFISYSSKDKPIADAICANLEASGIRCWIAPRDIAAGEDWPTSIAKAISQSQALVLVFSAHSNSSEKVGRELFLAASHKLVIIPFKIEDIEPEPGMQYYLARTHWLDALNPPTREQIQSLVDCVKTLVPIKGLTIPEIQAQSGNSLRPAVPPAGGMQASMQTSKKRLGSPWLWVVPIGIVLISLLGWAIISLVSNPPAATSQPTQQPDSIATLPPTIAPTIAPTITSTIAPNDLSGPTITPSSGVKTVNFTKVYISDAFNDNSLEWSVGDIVGPWWLGTRTIENGVLDWDGTSEQVMSSRQSPDAADKQDHLSDVQVSARVNLVNQALYGGYGLLIRGSSDLSSNYTYLVSGDQFSLQASLGDDTWKTVLDWQTSPYITTSGWNTMMIQAVGSHFRLFFNDHLLAEVDDASLPSGQSGLMICAWEANEKIQVQFDDFEVLLPYP